MMRVLSPYQITFMTFVLAFDHDCNMNHKITRTITPEKGVLWTNIE